MSVRPISITADRAQKTLSVLWEDGHLSVYSFSLLRAGCPCAGCQGGHENMKDVPDASVFLVQLPDSPAVRLVTVQAVGSYAITPVWEDGHAYGIYRWEYLRALCPCPLCRQR
ncbi:MAG: DUF971 domain-containing protein [Anaerolineales bacterium]|nr:DUF971 domain-containing protein [Anaerolineales bacterium]MDW8227993.1 DUF971 domain-containing protein [Anaerolineales bacterium]